MHKSQKVLLEDLKTAAKQVVVGGEYYHYKNPENRYKVLQLAITEADETVCVIYQALYGEMLTFVRPLKSWLDKVEWQGKTVNRFTKI